VQHDLKIANEIICCNAECAILSGEGIRVFHVEHLVSKTVNK
jgi:hypothetical protein